MNNPWHLSKIKRNKTLEKTRLFGPPDTPPLRDLAVRPPGLETHPRNKSRARRLLRRDAVVAERQPRPKARGTSGRRGAVVHREPRFGGLNCHPGKTRLFGPSDTPPPSVASSSVRSGWRSILGRIEGSASPPARAVVAERRPRPRARGASGRRGAVVHHAIVETLERVVLVRPGVAAAPSRATPAYRDRRFRGLLPVPVQENARVVARVYCHPAVPHRNAYLLQLTYLTSTQ